MSRSAIPQGQTVYSDTDTGTLKGVYILAIELLGSTHHVDNKVMTQLAEAVFETYSVSASRPPLAKEDVERLAVSSVNLLKLSSPHILSMRQ